jgi:hypothetical protein
LADALRSHQYNLVVVGASRAGFRAAKVSAFIFYAFFNGIIGRYGKLIGIYVKGSCKSG